MTNQAVQASRRASSNLRRTLIGQSAVLAVLLVSGVVVPRLLGVEEYGVYAAALAIVAMLQAGSSLGLQQVQLRYLAPLRRSPDSTPVAASLASTIWAVRLALSLIAGGLASLWLGASSTLGFSTSACLLLGTFCFARSAEQATRSFFLPLGHAGKAAGFELLRVCASLAAIVTFYPYFGLLGVFCALVVINAALAVLDSALLVGILPLRLAAIDLGTLRRFRRYSLLSYLGQIASTAHGQFTVYAVATWVAPRQAGILAVAVQLHNLARELYLSARRSLMPILAELEEAGQQRRLAYWGGLLMRYGAAIGTLGLVSWCLLGGWVVRGLLPRDFAAVHSVAAVVLLGVVFFFCAGSCVGLLYTKGLAGVVAVNTILYAAAAGVGLVAIIRSSSAGSADRIAWIYAGSAALYWVTTYVSLGWLGKLWLPFSRTLWLLVPTVVALPSVSWSASFPIKLGALLSFVPVYGTLAAAFGLLPARELREVFGIMTRAGRDNACIR